MKPEDVGTIDDLLKSIELAIEGEMEPSEFAKRLNAEAKGRLAMFGKKMILSHFERIVKEYKIPEPEKVCGFAGKVIDQLKG